VRLRCLVSYIIGRVDITLSRILCFLGTAPFVGLAGAIITLQKFRIAPSASFSIADWTVS
jgi:branched-chain amino acid transport system permease protein